MGKMMATFAAVLFAFEALASDEVRHEVVDGVTWYYKIKIERNEKSHSCQTNAIVTVAAGEDKYMGDLSIPTSLGGATVTEIDGAFNGCNALTSVEIPSTVKVISNWAFHGCHALLEVTMSEGLTELDTFAFGGCVALTHVTIPSTVKIMNHGAFAGCEALTSVDIRSGVTSIGDSAFYGCHSLKSVTLPSTVSNIGNSAFHECDSLKNVLMSEGVKLIGKEAFRGCHALMHFEVPSSVIALGDDVLDGCSSLTNLSVSYGNKNYKCVDNCIVSASGKTLIAAALADAQASIPDGVKVIPSGIFSGNERLAGISLPDSVIRIPERAFWGCSSLTSVTIPSSVKSIGENAFANCDALTEVRFLGKIPAGVEKSGLPNEAEQARRKAEQSKEEERKIEREQRMAEQEKRKAEQERDKVQRETKAAEEKTERELWSTWPTYCDDGIGAACAKELRTILWEDGDDNGWTNGCGLCVVEKAATWRKYDERGALVQIGRKEDFSEYHWMTNYVGRMTVEAQKKWAADHGMTYDEAKQKHDGYMSRLGLQRSSLLGGRRPMRAGLGSLRERRAMRAQWQAEAAQAAAEKERIAAEREAQREAERAAEKEQREKEREAERTQLLQIQEELRKSRMGK